MYSREKNLVVNKDISVWWHHIVTIKMHSYILYSSLSKKNQNKAFMCVCVCYTEKIYSCYGFERVNVSCQNSIQFGHCGFRIKNSLTVRVWKEGFFRPFFLVFWCFASRDRKVFALNVPACVEEEKDCSIQCKWPNGHTMHWQIKRKLARNTITMGRTPPIYTHTWKNLKAAFHYVF